MKSLSRKEMQHELVAEWFREEAGGRFGVHASHDNSSVFEVRQKGCDPVFDSIGIHSAATHCAMENTKIETSVYRQTVEHIKHLEAKVQQHIRETGNTSLTSFMARNK